MKCSKPPKKVNSLCPSRCQKLKKILDVCANPEGYNGLSKTDTELMGVITAVYSVNAFRDDLGKIVINPKSSQVDDALNYLDTHTGKVVIESHKTAKTHGALEV